MNGDDAILQIDGRKADQFPVGRADDILWAPDSRALILTSSFGASGPVVSYVKVVPGRGLSDDLDFTEMIRKDFELKHPKVECNDAVNVGGLAWINDSRDVLFIAEVPTTPQCGATWGYFDVYEISIPGGKIESVYSMREARKRFKEYMGPALRRDVPILK